MKKKKLASLLLSAITITSASASVSAANSDWNTSDDTISKYNIGKTETSADIAISGSISSATINIDVPLSTTFQIDENMNFTAPPIVLRNNSPVAIRVDGVSIQPANSTSPNLIDPNTYTDDEWQNLNVIDTNRGIALGLLTDNSKSDVRLDVVGGTRWFVKQNSAYSDLYLGTIKPATAALPSPKLTLDLQAKYGRVWGDTTKIDYTLCLSFSAE